MGDYSDDVGEFVLNSTDFFRLCTSIYEKDKEKSLVEGTFTKEQACIWNIIAEMIKSDAEVAKRLSKLVYQHKLSEGKLSADHLENFDIIACLELAENECK